MSPISYTPWFTTDEEGVNYLNGRSDLSLLARPIRHQVVCPDADTRDRISSRLLLMGFDVVDNDTTSDGVIVTVRRHGTPTIGILNTTRANIEAVTETHGCGYEAWATYLVLAPGSRLAKLRATIRS